jgi:Ca2+-binding RTX toxin-like protein
MKRLLTSLLRSFSSAGAPKTRRSKLYRRPRFERLEERQVRAGASIEEIEIGNEQIDVLWIEGTNNRDRIEVRYVDPEDPNDSDVRAIVRDADFNVLVDQVFASNDFDEIHVYGLDDIDFITNLTNVRSRLDGGAGHDTLRGGTGGDMLIGGDGDDKYMFTTLGQLGTDLGFDRIVENDNEGVDRLYFDDFDWGITLDLALATEQIVSPGHLRLLLQNPNNLEVVWGTDFDDVLRGNSRANHLDGNNGNDVLEGRAGDDVLAGGRGDDIYVFRTDRVLGTDTIDGELPDEGIDTLAFREFGRAITLDIGWTDAQTPQVVSSGYLSLRLAGVEGSDIENVQGTNFDDWIAGNSRNNSIEGNGGDDIIGGFDGDDVLEGGAGNDILAGGEDNDTFVFRSNRELGVDMINDVPDGTNTLDFSAFGHAITLDLSPATGSPQIVSSGFLSLKFINAEAVENVRGTNFDDTIFGNAHDNSILGNGGNDRIYGRAGNDVLDGGSGNDRLYGEGGFDQLYGRAGMDVLDGGFDGYADKLEGGGDRDFFAFYHEQYTDRRTGRVYSRPRADEQQIEDANPAEYDVIFAMVAYSSGYGAPNW